MTHFILDALGVTLVSGGHSCGLFEDLGTAQKPGLALFHVLFDFGRDLIGNTFFKLLHILIHLLLADVAARQVQNILLEVFTASQPAFARVIILVFIKQEIKLLAP